MRTRRQRASGAWQPKFFRFKLGAFELTTISDFLEAFIDGPFPLIGANANEADVQELMRANLLPNKIPAGIFLPPSSTRARNSS